MEKKSTARRILLNCLLIFLMVLVGCGINIGCIGPHEKFTKIVHMPLTPLSPGSSFATKTHNGSITINGSDVTECNVTATVVGRASTIEEAEKVAEQTQLIFERSNDGLIFKIKRPDHMINRSVSVSLDVIVPDRIDLELETHNGAINIENISGQVEAITHNGKVTAHKISGTTKLITHNGKIESEEISGNTNCQTHNGQIESKDISGDINFRTHNGSVKAYFSETAEPDCNISMVTHNGSIELTTPPNYSANVKVSTHNGSIDTNLPVTVIGKVSKNKLTGTIGDGEGELNLGTYNGSIKIR